MEPVETKPVVKSKTIWLNIGAGILFVLQALGIIEPTSIAGFELDAEVQALLLAAVNVVLRFATKKPVAL